MATIEALKTRVKQVACDGASKVVDFDPRENLIADPRGGSTWVQELVSRVPRTAFLWEPLNLNRGLHFKAIGFRLRQEIQENAVWEEARAAFDRAFRGKALGGHACNPSEWSLLLPEGFWRG